MSANTFLVYWTLVVAAAIILALAAYLTAIAYYLYRAGGSSRSHLARLAVGLASVRGNAAPLGQRLSAVAQALAALRNELQAVDDHLAEAADALRR
jgi:hypothetical protein